MRIGELADAVGVNPKIIRYYESIGLLPEPDRTAVGYRDYGEEDIERLAFVRRAQQLDLTLDLDEIREILALRGQGRRSCDYVMDVARSRLRELDRRIAEMQRARDELHGLLHRARDLPARDGEYCGLIEHRETATTPRCRQITARPRHSHATFAGSRAETDAFTWR